MTNRNDNVEPGLTPVSKGLDPFRQPVHTLQMSVRQRGRSPLNGTVWALSLLISLLSVLAGVVSLLGEHSTARLWLTLPIVWAAWILAVRMLLLDTAIRRFWMVWLGVSVLSLLVSGNNPVGYLIASALALVFLLGRRYRSYRHTTSRRRAVIFFCGLIALLAVGTMERIPEQDAWFSGLLRFSTNYAILSLRLFWAFTLFSLFFGMRLHFLRLRPKLTVTGLLLVLVPFVLIISLAGVALFGAIGGSRATQGRHLVEEWLALADSTPAVATELFGPPLDASVSPASTVLATMSGRDFAQADTTCLVHLDEDVYIWSSPRDGNPAQVHAFGGRAEQRLSRLLDCEVTLQSKNTFTVETSSSGVSFSTVSEEELGAGGDGATSDPEAAGAADATEPETSPTSTIHLGDIYRVRKLAYFGAIPLEVVAVSGDSLRTENVLLTLKARPIDVAQSYVSHENPVTLAVVIVLGIIAGLFLILEGLALFFGIRIVGGITSAVRKLRQGTERISRGELDTRIELPNEDEFGDLADSFNEMTAAIRVGQEQALQRERLEQELMLARRIQERLLPRATPQLEGFQVAGTSIPSLMVGGDYFDFIDVGDGKLGIAVGDVSGKGIPAAMLMSNLHASLHGQVMHPSSVGKIVQRINTLLARSTDPHMFATFIFGVLDIHTGNMVFANAGHDSPVLVRASGEVERPGESDLILGMLPGQEYRESTVSLDEGDVLVFYTDGVSEAVAPPMGSRDRGPRPPEAAAATMKPQGLDSESMSAGRSEDKGGKRAKGGKGAKEVQGGLALAGLDGGFSDGNNAASDTAATDDEFFGEDRLVEVVRRRAGGTAEEIQRAVVDSVRGYAGGRAQSDDITLVVIKRQASRPSDSATVAPPAAESALS